MPKAKELIGASFGWGAGRHAVQFGPDFLQEHLLKNEPWRANLKASLPYSEGKKLKYEQRLDQVEEFTHRLSLEVIASAATHIPIILGGDHAIAIGTWSGISVAKEATENFGLMWIDAHMDSHVPQTSPSSNIHGMPLAALMGYGEKSLVNLQQVGAKLNPHHVVLIGVRSYEPEEAAFLKKLGVKIYFMEEVNKRGFKTIFEEALIIVSEKTKGFGISLDMDAFDPTLAPGTGTPELNGITEIEDVIHAFASLKTNEKFCAFEIAEFDPTKDVSQKTGLLVQRIVRTLLGVSNV